LLRLYADQGEKMLDKLRGMFAFAIWDDIKKGLFLARDHFGMKPLYYADNGKSFRFASQVKALLKSNQINTSLDAAGQVGFFLWGSIPEPYTLYKDIHALPAGSSLWVDAQGAREVKRYWSVNEAIANNSGAATDLRALLKDSVVHHLIADVPVGVFLSAGLDSTTLTGLASESAKNLRTLTLGFSEYRNTANDEVPLAEKTAAWYGTQHETRWVQKKDFEDHLPDLLAAMDQPTIDGVNVYFVSRATAQAGLKVAISGLGGDELFGGYPSFQDIPEMVKFFGPAHYIPYLGRTLRWLSAPLIKQFTSPKYAGLFEYGGTYGGAYLLRRGLFMPWELPQVLDGDIVKQGWRELQPLLHLQETVDVVSGARRKVSALEMSWYMRNQLLRDADWAGMAHSLEIRLPLVDVIVLKGIFNSNKNNGLCTKIDMANTPQKPLPAEILNRPKSGFAVPVQEWLLQSSGIKERGLRGWAKFVINHYTA
jgi:asparagine synthase (glutamine-hydrolysing)